MEAKSRMLVASVVASVLGLVSIIAPVFILSLKHYDAPLFPWVRSGIEGLSFLSALLLVLSGLALGYRCPKHPFLVGVCTMAAFPLLALIEMLADTNSHNLFPIEFFFYGLISLIPVAGAYVGRSVYAFAHKQR